MKVLGISLRLDGVDAVLTDLKSRERSLQKLGTWCPVWWSVSFPVGERLRQAGWPDTHIRPGNRLCGDRGWEIRSPLEHVPSPLLREVAYRIAAELVTEKRLSSAEALSATLVALYQDPAELEAELALRELAAP